MANTLTIATFNVENLFTRFKFRGRRVKNPPGSKKKTRFVPYTPKQLAKAVEDGFIIDRNVFKRYLKPSRTLTAKALKGVNADVVGLQEVENLDILKLFNTRYLKGASKFKYQYLIDGNDNRFIDVALLSKLEVDFLRTHQFRKKGKSKVFSRDCLEAHVKVGGKTVPFFVNHFTSMMRGRPESRQRRRDQSNELLKILRERFGNNFGDHDFVVLGDLNDYMEPGAHAASGIKPLLESGQMENVVDRLPAGERWTHYYSGDKSYHQLDYILISKSLAKKNPTVKPVIERRGQPKRVNRPGQPKRVKKFFPEIKGTLKASDHCPVAITLKV